MKENKVREFLQKMGDKLSGNKPDKEGLSDLHLNILTVAMQLHAQGIEWWFKIEVVDEMSRQRRANRLFRSKVYGGIDDLIITRHIDSRLCADPSKGVQHRVSDFGRGERARGSVRDSSRRVLGIPVAQRKPI